MKLKFSKFGFILVLVHTYFIYWLVQGSQIIELRSDHSGYAAKATGMFFLLAIPVDFFAFLIFLLLSIFLYLFLIGQKIMNDAYVTVSFFLIVGGLQWYLLGQLFAYLFSMLSIDALKKGWK